MNTGYGFDPWGLGPLGLPETDPAVEHLPIVHASILIDAATRAYVFDDQGNPMGMDGTAQRVLLLVSYAEIVASVIDARSLKEAEYRILAALSPLQKETPPAIKDLSVTVRDNGRGFTESTVAFMNLKTNQIQTVVLR